MKIIDQYTPPKVEAYEDRTYTGVELAKAYGVSDAAVRNGWYKWLLKVAPAELLKDGKSFTTFAKTLFDEFAAVDPAERHAWVADAKQRYAPEWSSAGVIDCDVVPDSVGTTLALLSANNSTLQASIALQFTEINAFIDGMNTADADLSQGQQQQAIARGTQQAIQQFKLEETVKETVLNELRQRRMGGQS